MFSRATITLGIGPHSSFRHGLQILKTIRYSYTKSHKSVVYPLSSGDVGTKNNGLLPWLPRDIMYALDACVECCDLRLTDLSLVRTGSV